MAFIEKYMQQMGCHCERCAATDDKVRLVCLSSGGGAAYVCTVCVRDILRLLEVRVVYPQPKWAMIRPDLIGWIDPLGRITGPNPDDLRAAMSRVEGEFREMFKDFLEFKGGYTDRNNFYRDARKKIKNLFNVVEEYLKKTTA